MALNEQLNKFKKQQEKCQSTLSSIASSRAAPSRPYVPAPAMSYEKPVPAKFSNDTKRLQEIYYIRNSPVGAQMKRVIQLLFETRQAFTPEQINEACYVNMIANKDVFASMKTNPKVHYDGRRFSYKAKHDVKDKSQLLSLVNKYPDGISVIDLNDAYPNVLEDLQALKDSGEIWLLSNTDSKGDIAYPNDFKSQIKVDDEFKTLFRGIEIPSDMMDVEKELKKFSLTPMTNTAARRAAANIHGVLNNKSNQKKKKKREITKRTKLTNTHLSELFK